MVQTDRQTGRQADRQTTGRQTDNRQTDRQTDRQAGGQAGRHTVPTIESLVWIHSKRGIHMNQIHLSAFWTTLARLARHLFAERWLRQNAPALVTRTTQSKPPIVRRRNSYSKPASAQEEHTSWRKKPFGHQQSDAHKQTNQQTNKNTPNRQKHKQTHNTRSRAHKHTPL